jgi:RHS repeat-associated protein
MLVLDDTTANPVWRQETPYGGPRGTAPSSWPDNNGFLGKPADINTGLTVLGARQYDPTTGRFLSVDPVLNASNPSLMGGYAYAADNPVTQSDPSGLMPCIPGGPCGSFQALETYENKVQQQQQKAYNSLANSIENQQLENCYCHPATMIAMVHRWQNSSYKAQEVSNYVATEQYDQKLLAQAQAEEAAKRAQSHGCGFLGLSCVGHWVSHQWDAHWRGIEQTMITAAGVLAAAGCVALTGGLGTVGCVMGVGALVSMGNKAVSGDKITPMGMLTAGAEGALAGAISAACLEACGGLLGAAAVNFVAGGAIAGGDYLTQTSPHDWNGSELLGAVDGGLLGSEPYPDEWFKRLLSVGE